MQIDDAMTQAKAQFTAAAQAALDGHPDAERLCSEALAAIEEARADQATEDELAEILDSMDPADAADLADELVRGLDAIDDADLDAARSRMLAELGDPLP